MHLEQIIIKPDQNKLIIQYSDDLKRPSNLMVDTQGNATVAALVADARGRIPKPENHPDKPQIEKQIVQLENRLKQLKQSIGQAAAPVG